MEVESKIRKEEKKCKKKTGKEAKPRLFLLILPVSFPCLLYLRANPHETVASFPRTTFNTGHTILLYLLRTCAVTYLFSPPVHSVYRQIILLYLTNLCLIHPFTLPIKNSLCLLVSFTCLIYLRGIYFTLFVKNPWLLHLSAATFPHHSLVYLL